MITLSLPETIRTERLSLKRLRYEDAPEIFYGYASKPGATQWVSWPTHRSIEDTVSFLGRATTAWSLGKDYSYSVRIATTNVLAGSIGIINNDGDVQFGYVLGPAHWHKGFATEACRAVLHHVGKLPEVKRVSTFVSVENYASIRVLEKCGFRREATLKNWFLFPNAGPEKQDCFSYVYPLPDR